MSKQQKELDNLVKEVLKKQDRIIPIIGDDCFVGYVEYEKKQTLVPLQQWIAENLLGDDSEPKIKNRIHSEGYRGLDILFEEYKRIHEYASFVDYKDAIISIIEDGINDNKIFLREDVRDFLSAGKFEVIATTCPFHILENQVSCGSKKYNISSFAPISLNGSTIAMLHPRKRTRRNHYGANCPLHCSGRTSTQHIPRTLNCGHSKTFSKAICRKRTLNACVWWSTTGGVWRNYY